MTYKNADGDTNQDSENHRPCKHNQFDEKA